MSASSSGVREVDRWRSQHQRGIQQKRTDENSRTVMLGLPQGQGTGVIFPNRRKELVTKVSQGPVGIYPAGPRATAQSASIKSCF